MSKTKPELQQELRELKAELARCRKDVEICVDKLEREEERQLFSQGPVVLFKWCNQPGWPVEFVSKNVEQILGYPAEDFIAGRVAYADIIHKDDVAQVAEEVENFTSKAQDHYTHSPYRVTKKNKDVIWLLDNTAAIRNSQGEVSHFAGYVLDITDRVETEIRLKESENRWNFALQGAGDGVWDWNVATSKVFFSNQWKKMLGHEPDEIPDDLKEWENRVHPEDMEKVMADLVPHLEGRTEYYENVHRVLCKDGSYKWILDRGKVIARDAEGKPVRVIGTHTDLTEQKTVHEELEKARRHISDILENTTDAFFELDRDFKFTYVNRRAEETLETKRSDLLGKNIWDLFPMAVGTTFQAQYDKAMKNQEVTEFEAYFQPFETWFEVHAYPTPDSLSVYFNDITERKRLELEREKIFNMSMDMICVAGFDGYFKKLNPAWERILGWSKQKMMSSPWLDFVYPEDKASTVEAGSRLAKGHDVEQFQNRYLTRDGQYLWLSWNAVPLPEEKNIIAVARDVTLEIKSKEAVTASEERFRLLAEKSPVGITLNDSRQTILFMNPKLEEMVGYGPDDIRSVADWIRLTHVSPQTLEDTLALAGETIATAHSNQTESPPQIREVKCKNGNIKLIQLQYMPIDDRGMTIFIDITEQKRLERKLERLANTDALTGLFNRRRFMEKAQEEWLRFRRYKRSMSVLMFDLDHFKRINDTHGHEGGDKILQAFAKKVSALLRDMDIFGRIGGEEFAILLPETDFDSAMHVAERMRASVQDLTITYSDKELKVTVSVGVARAKIDDPDFETVLKRSDDALYRAKTSGRNTVIGIKKKT